MNIFVIFILIVFMWIYFWLKKRQNYWRDRGFPSGKFEFPFGSFRGIGTDKSLCVGLDEYYRKFKGKGPAVGLFCFTKPVILPTDPELIKSILIQNFDNFHDRFIYYNKEDDPISVHLLTLEGKYLKLFYMYACIRSKYVNFLQEKHGGNDEIN